MVNWKKKTNGLLMSWRNSRTVKRRNDMPKVCGKSFPYTDKGKRAARIAKKKKKMGKRY